jgi:hypothetical protein
MGLSRRAWLKQGVGAGAAAIGSPRALRPLVLAAPRIRLGVSTYSYWHLKTEKYPVEKPPSPRV